MIMSAASQPTVDLGDAVMKKIEKNLCDEDYLDKSYSNGPSSISISIDNKSSNIARVECKKQEVLNKDDKGNTRSKEGPPFMLAGYVAGLGGSMMFSLSILCLKLLPEDEGYIGKFKALFFRGFFMALLCAITIFLRKSTFKIKRDELLVNILRCIFGSIAVVGSYISLLYIGMGEATALIFSSPIWTSIMGHFILNERLRWSHLIAVPISLVGMIFIAHPALLVNVDNMTSLTASQTISETPKVAPTLEPNASAPNSQPASPLSLHPNFNKGDQLIGADIGMSLNDPELLEETNLFDDSFEHRWPGILVAILTSFMVTITYIVLKFRKSTPVQTTTFYFGVALMLLSLSVLVFTGFGEPPKTYSECFLLMGNGIFSWLGQSLFQWAFLYEDASILSILRTLDVALSFVLSAIFLSDNIYWTSILGSTIIGVVVISIILSNYLQQMSCCMRVAKDKKTNGDN